MAIPLIDIQRAARGIYEWRIVVGAELVDADVGEASITDCLISSIGSMPSNIKLAEIRYRGIHMGTFSTEELNESPGEIATIVCNNYAEFLA